VSASGERDLSPIVSADTLILGRTVDGGLVLTDRPAARQGFAGAFVIAGVLGLLAVALDGDGSWPVLGVTAIAVAVIVGGLHAFDAAAGSVVTLDPAGRTLVVERRRWRRQRWQFDTARIRAWRTVAGTDADGDPVVRPVIDLFDAPPLPLSLLWQSDREAVDRVVDVFARRVADAHATPPP
jgi:hypothetical protein